jgi:hypothetical protein
VSSVCPVADSTIKVLVIDLGHSQGTSRKRDMSDAYQDFTPQYVRTIFLSTGIVILGEHLNIFCSPLHNSKMSPPYH